MKDWKSRRTILAAAVALALSTSSSGIAAIVVTQGTDAHVPGRCSLREAIESANTWMTPPGTDCEAGAGGGSQILVPYDRIELVQGSLQPNGGVDIAGTSPSGRTLITRASGAGGFSIISTTAVFADLGIRLERLQISAGVASIDGGGGIFAQTELTLVDSIVSGNNAFGDGGGIRATESLTLISSTVSDNDTLSGGGGIAGSKYVQLIDSTIAYNSSQGPGGGIAVAGLAGVRASNSTIAGNATHANGGHGGGIFIGPSSLATLSNSTVTRNTVNSYSTGAGIHVDPESPPVGEYDRLTLNSTLVTRNVAGKYEQNIASGAALTVAGLRNLIGPSSVETTPPIDTLDCPAGLGTLGSHGGPTQTIALSAGSCAIDQGTSLGLAFDQRGAGFPRVVGLTADIGAFEYSDAIFEDGFEGP
jgi:predicted outer membrane repeat protein